MNIIRTLFSRWYVMVIALITIGLVITCIYCKVLSGRLDSSTEKIKQLNIERDTLSSRVSLLEQRAQDYTRALELVAATHDQEIKIVEHSSQSVEELREMSDADEQTKFWYDQQLPTDVVKYLNSRMCH